MRKQLQSGLSHEEQPLSSPSPDRLRAWRSVLRKRPRASRRARRRDGARRRDPDSLVRPPRPPGRRAGGIAHERARRANPVQQERLHSRCRPHGGRRPRAPRAARERPAVVPRSFSRTRAARPWRQRAGTIALRSRSTFRVTCPTPTSRRLRGHSRRSADTRDPCALGASAARPTAAILLNRHSAHSCRRVRLASSSPQQAPHLGDSTRSTELRFLYRLDRGRTPHRRASGSQLWGLRSVESSDSGVPSRP